MKIIFEFLAFKYFLSFFFQLFLLSLWWYSSIVKPQFLSVSTTTECMQINSTIDKHHRIKNQPVTLLQNLLTVNSPWQQIENENLSREIPRIFFPFSSHPPKHIILLPFSSIPSISSIILISLLLVQRKNIFSLSARKRHHDFCHPRGYNSNHLGPLPPQRNRQTPSQTPGQRPPNRPSPNQIPHHHQMQLQVQLLLPQSQNHLARPVPRQHQTRPPTPQTSRHETHRLHRRRATHASQPADRRGHLLQGGAGSAVCVCCYQWVAVDGTLYLSHGAVSG